MNVRAIHAPRVVAEKSDSALFYAAFVVRRMLGEGKLTDGQKELRNPTLYTTVYMYMYSIICIVRW